VDIRIEAGGAIHRLSEAQAVALVDGLRSYSNYREAAVPAADKLERARVQEVSEPITFTTGAPTALARGVDLMCGIESPGTS
jgi:hypothetical protein